MMLGHAHSTLAQNRRMVANQNDVALKAMGGESTHGSEPGVDEMLVLGNYNVTQQLHPSAVSAPSPSAPGPANSKLGTLAKLGVGAALLATGIGGGVGASLIFSALTQRPSNPPVVRPVPKQSQTLFDLDFGPEVVPPPPR
jgi:hypothetical protein